jgi:hypothetical protein
VSPTSVKPAGEFWVVKDSAVPRLEMMPMGWLRAEATMAADTCCGVRSK